MDRPRARRPSDRMKARGKDPTLPNKARPSPRLLPASEAELLPSSKIEGVWESLIVRRK
jgi:hypothetical protein